MFKMLLIITKETILCTICEDHDTASMQEKPGLPAIFVGSWNWRGRLWIFSKVWEGVCVLAESYRG